MVKINQDTPSGGTKTMGTILCVEDNEQNMRLVRKILNHAGYTVVEAMDGETALSIVADADPDLILMDVNLPDIDGLEVTARMKASGLAHVPIIALTANAMVGDREKALEAGCDGYLPKPISKADLLDTISLYLASV